MRCEAQRKKLWVQMNYNYLSAHQCLKQLTLLKNFFPHLAKFDDIKVIGNEFERDKRSQPWV